MGQLVGGSSSSACMPASTNSNYYQHTYTNTLEQKADLEGVSREEMYAPPEHAAQATPLRDDVVTEGAYVIVWVDALVCMHH